LETDAKQAAATLDAAKTYLGKLRTSRKESQRFSTSPEAIGDLLAVRIGGRLPSAMQDNRGSAEEMRHNLYRQGK